MRSTGIVRKVDELGRVVLPMELRRTLGIASGDPIEIFVSEDQIVLQKYVPNMACFITGEISDENLQFGEKMHLSKEGALQLVEQIQEAFKLQKA
jgi:AbrB family transcriptional regulator, transcriptional pleiotropic regulator of transition state genes